MNVTQLMLSIPILTINNTNWFIFSDRAIQTCEVSQIVPLSSSQFQVWCRNANGTVFNEVNSQTLSV